MSNCPIFLRVVENRNSMRALFCKDKTEAMKLFYLFGGANASANFNALWDYINNNKTSKLVESLTRKLNKQKWRTIEDISCCIIDFNTDSAIIVDADVEIDTKNKLVTARRTLSFVHPPKTPPKHDSLVHFLPGFFLADRLI